MYIQTRKYKIIISKKILLYIFEKKLTYIYVTFKFNKYKNTKTNKNIINIIWKYKL